LRRLAILLALVILLLVMITLERLTADWHYIIPAEPGAVLYTATFDAFTDDWELYEGRLSAQIFDGRLRLSVDAPQSGPYSVTRPHFSDFDMRAEARPVEGPLDNGYGVIFRLQNRDNRALDDDSYYLFLVSSDGYYQVQRVLNGQSKVLSAWIDSPLINQGNDAINWLRVVASGPRFQFFINGQQVRLCVPDNPDGESTYFRGQCVGGQMVDTLVDDTISTGQLGVVAVTLSQPGVVVDYDNILVLGPEPIIG
jgi:hypothetical protein